MLWPRYAFLLRRTAVEIVSRQLSRCVYLYVYLELELELLLDLMLDSLLVLPLLMSAACFVAQWFVLVLPRRRRRILAAVLARSRTTDPAKPSRYLDCICR